MFNDIVNSALGYFNNNRDALINQMQNDPRIRNNPNSQEYLRVLQSGDQQKIQQLGQNLCKTYGVNNPQDIIPNIISFLQNR